MRHPVRALLVGPIAVPLAYWLGILVYGLISHLRFDWLQALRELAVIFAFGLPIAYVATLVWGVPVVYLLRRLDRLRALPLIAAGALGGTAVAVWFSFVQPGGSVIRVHMPLAAGAALGVIAGIACWWAGQGRSRPDR